MTKKLVQIIIVLSLCSIISFGNHISAKTYAYNEEKELDVEVEYSKYHKQDIIDIRLTPFIVPDGYPQPYGVVVFLLKKDLQQLFSALREVVLQEDAAGIKYAPTCAYYGYEVGDGVPTHSDSDNMDAKLKIYYDDSDSLFPMIIWDFTFYTYPDRRNLHRKILTDPEDMFNLMMVLASILNS